MPKKKSAIKTQRSTKVAAIRKALKKVNTPAKKVAIKFKLDAAKTKLKRATTKF